MLFPRSLSRIPCAALAVWALHAAVSAQALPPEVDAALARAKVPRDAVSFLVTDAQGGAAPRLAHRSTSPMNPASTMKLVTTIAALDLLGPAYTWTTPVYLDGTVQNGVLNGSLFIKGQGDPKLVMERLWLLMRRVQGMGIKTIAGDIVLDRSALEVPEPNPAKFDGEPLRPYNVAPDAMLLNFKSVVMTFTPDRSANLAYVQYDPPLAGVSLPSTVALNTTAPECGDYRGALKADFSDPLRIRFGGNYPAACGEKIWPVAYADPKAYAARTVQGLWENMGGRVLGSVRTGSVPAALLAGKPALVTQSASLAEVIRDINKYSNNVMAQQVFLTLGRVAGTTQGLPVDTVADVNLPPGSFAASRTLVQRWWKDRIGTDDAPVLDNGSGLSRQERISAQAMGRLLQATFTAPFMPELMSSLPITGVDGTLKRIKTRTSGTAHLKTGTLNGVVTLAGYVHAVSGKRYVLVAFINHPNANEARPALDALVDWAGRDQ
ncbi:MAG: D-alanyl-D-alanine carboxypeptidase/D-alanyl-D-alanine-endopeptidase [Rhodoferax sp.]|uniref:D-alanyl-D-alanine carboxypeptidase/D-alanyl-D-alanine endopeptidase n=1 Tax=Rhodoferax sp. TaxID=50421 RepID=UPI002ACEB9A1|nr:D-alanyl-D-alanine carboxypeptidase/D-alanyl-D-alanine-endopeptidase [Rhodoferax sp.]MDZ7890815.1 D-alanyl-D-alanine carboxypeptidase/D-alanyl-D-alanine-endopeptidase [Rhodoferax sp.]